MEYRQRRQVIPPTAGQGASSRARVAASSSTAQFGARAFRRDRSSGLFEAVARLDAGLDEGTRAGLAAWIAEEYATEYGAVPIGMLATCHLGGAYVDHRLSLLEAIVEHYFASSPVPAPFADARPLVRSGAYLYIEVYDNGELVPVRPDGSVVA